MAHLDYSERFEQGRAAALMSATAHLLADWWAARRAHQAQINQQWEDRQAFNTLLGKEDWVLRDLGAHRGDIDYLSKQPLHINAARELERLRADNRFGR